MQLVEVLVASTVFAVSAGGAMQMSAATAASTLMSRTREQVLESIEQDRLSLQGYWRRSTTQSMTCLAVLVMMESQAGQVMPPAGVQRQLRRSSEGELLEITWQGIGSEAVRRRRLVSPLALGLCAPSLVAAGGLP